MEKRHLEELLESLHRELGDADTVDEDSRSLLHGMMDEIRQALERSGEDADGGSPINRRLQEIALRFETDHPRIAATISQLTDSLAKLGI
ncbi:MAG: DUF4404 family protein [Deltaproteobacteria bacterium]|nr:DUF4404 family protein [Deltaproteobacteria bacterium]MBW2413764.1 DUF4404 family protein [Deltaproteobacteria bacterium]